MKRILIPALILLLAVLIGFSSYLSATRIFQVDECYNVYSARILSTGQAETSHVNFSLFVTPLVWLYGKAARSIELFLSARSVALAIFWLNMVLAALATGERLLSGRGLIALVAVATLAPLWDYGFEIRHDNLLLTGLLLMWCIVRVYPRGPASYFLTGALVTAMQFTSFKSFAYTIPLSLAFLLLPPPGHNASRRKLGLAWAVGALAMFLAIRAAYGIAGVWDAYVSFVRWSLSLSSNEHRFGPGVALNRIFRQAPLLAALIPAALIAVVSDVHRRGRAALTWGGPLPEAALFLGALIVLFLNPTPFPYNLVNLIPFAFLFVFRFLSSASRERAFRPGLLLLAAAALAIAHLAPFFLASQRHLRWTNARQVKLMDFAERMTDPSRDPVYDAIGMVPTRRSISSSWSLHSFTVASIVAGPGPHLRDMLTAQPAAVFIPSYRTDWLSEEDHRHIRDRYVPLADDFWVLGNVLHPGGGSFTTVLTGRYFIAPLEGSGIAGRLLEGFMPLSKKQGDEPCANAMLDGAPLHSPLAELAAGTHRLETPDECRPVVIWVGPHFDQVPRVGSGDHRRLFVNWY